MLNTELNDQLKTVPKKTVVYVDAANIILSCKNVNLKIDILKLIQKLRDKYRPIKIIYFTGKFKSMQIFFEAIKNLDVELVFKEIYNENNKTKANCDVEISHRVTYDVENNFVSEIILVTGDGDFVHIADYINRNNYKIKFVAAEPISCSRMIKKRQFITLSYLREFGDEILIAEGEESETLGFSKIINDEDYIRYEKRPAST